MIAELLHASRRRKALLGAIDVKGSFEAWEETCVPSYVHANPLAAYISWRRLFMAAEICKRLCGRPSHILDFGSSIGELSYILEYDGAYNFVEIDDLPAEFLLAHNPRAHRLTLATVAAASCDVIFAIDSLEHNEDFGGLLGELAKRLKPGGILILSGPTENALYRLGRRIAGFKGDYHVTTIFDIELSASRLFDRVRMKTVPWGIPLFRISAWRQRNA